MKNSRAKWTILTYIAAHNNLDALGKRSLEQIVSVGSTSEVKHAVLFDGKNSAKRVLVGKAGETTIEEPLENFDSGDPVALYETVKWAFEQFPADHYGLILWSHGSGWRPEEIRRIANQVRSDKKVMQKEFRDRERAGAAQIYSLFRTSLIPILKKDTPQERAICFDNGSGNSLDTIELGRVTGRIKDLTGKPLDLLGMDACLMATLEIAYQIKQTACFMVASEELVPGLSWPYDLIFGELAKNPQELPHDLAARIVHDYVDFYTKNSPKPGEGDVTKVALDLSKIDSLSTAVDGLATALLADMPNQVKRLWDAQFQTKKAESKRPPPPNKDLQTKFDFYLYDLGTLSSRLASDALTSGAVQEAARQVSTVLQPGGAIIAEGHSGKWFDGIGGITTYLVPRGKDRISEYYGETAFARDTHWDEMLVSYHKKGN